MSDDDDVGVHEIVYLNVKCFNELNINNTYIRVHTDMHYTNTCLNRCCNLLNMQTLSIPNTLNVGYSMCHSVFCV